MSGYSAAFNNWWSHYPAYKRKGKGAAFKSWQKHNCETQSDRLIEVLQAQVERDEHFQNYTPLPTTYLNQGRFDDYVPKPKRAPGATRVQVEQRTESDPYMVSVNRVAVVWLMRRLKPIPKERLDGFVRLLRSLADDARELHAKGELKDSYAQTIRDELSDYMART